MMRIGKRRPRVPGFIGGGCVLDERDRLLRHEVRAVELRVVGRLIHLPPTIRASSRRSLIAIRHNQVLVPSTLIQRPMQMVAGDSGAMVDRKFNMSEPVEVIRPLGQLCAVTLEVLKLIPPSGVAMVDGCSGLDGEHRISAHAVLQMRLADQASAVTLIPELPHVGSSAPLE